MKNKSLKHIYYTLGLLISVLVMSSVGYKMLGYTTSEAIFELDIRNNSGANIIGLKRQDKSYLINPLPETTLTSSDQLFALGSKAQITHLRKTIYTDGA